jgi:hypothetical protein
MLVADEGLGIVLGADRLEPFRARIVVARVALVDRPRPRQRVVDDSDLVVQVA